MKAPLTVRARWNASPRLLLLHSGVFSLLLRRWGEKKQSVKKKKKKQSKGSMRKSANVSAAVNRDFR